MTHLLAESILGRLIVAFEAAGVALLPVKGIVTASELYDSVADRPISDIDIRVLPERLDDVAALAARRGWELLRYAKTYRNIVLRIDGLCIDVEASVGPPGLCALSIASMMARAERITRRGLVYLRPELHDHAIVLCINVFKDKLTYAAPWALADLERIVLRPDFDVARFVALASESGVTGLVWIVADWMESARESTAWGSVRDAIGVSPRPLYSKLYRALVHRDDNSFAIRLLARAGADSMRQQARALAVSFFWEAEAWRNRTIARRTR